MEPQLPPRPPETPEQKEQFKQYAVDWQLENVCKLLNGTIERFTMIDSRGVVKKKISIVYDVSDK